MDKIESKLDRNFEQFMEKFESLEQKYVTRREAMTAYAIIGMLITIAGIYFSTKQ